MNSIDLTPLYRSSVGYDRLANLLSSMTASDSINSNYPPYNIEALEEDRYAITLAVAGFVQDDLSIVADKGVLTVSGKRHEGDEKKYLHRGIANRSFERRFTLADYVEVTSASLENGLLRIELKREIPEAMKPQTIAINGTQSATIEHKANADSETKDGEHKTAA